MKDTIQKLKEIKEAVKDSNRDSMDFKRIKDEFLLWLSQFNFPEYTDAVSWEECLETFPDLSQDTPKPTEGLKLRFLLKLYTVNHRYIVSVIECFDADAHGKGILTVHVNIDQTEYNLQKTIELTYKDSFDNSLKPKQTLFVEPFDTNSFLDSLNNAGLAILGNELTGSMSHKELPTIKNIVPRKVSFPDTN